jgi:hypothetical protein
LVRSDRKRGADRAREFIEELIRGELDAVLARPRYERSKKAGHEGTPDITGHRHGSRPRSLIGSFGPIERRDNPRDDPNNDTSARGSACMSRGTTMIVMLEEEIKLYRFAVISPGQFFTHAARHREAMVAAD